MEVTVLCPDCNRGFKPRETVAVLREMPGRTWKAIQRICVECADDEHLLEADNPAGEEG